MKKPQEYGDAYDELALSKRIKNRQWFETGQTGEGRIDVKGKNFINATLITHSYRGARFVRCDFTASRISGFFDETELIECEFSRVDFDGSVLNGALIKDCRVFATTFRRLAEFKGAKVEGGNWSQSDLYESKWNEAVVKNVNFEQAHLARNKFHGAHFIGCNFRYANLFVADLKDTIFERCDFRDARIEGAKIQNTTFINCGFYGCLGTPLYKGSCQMISPDLSPYFDGSNVKDEKQIFAIWKFEGREPDEDQKYKMSDDPLIAIGKSDFPEWSIYLPRTKRRQQFNWVKNGGIGEKPINLAKKDFSRAFFSGSCFDQAEFRECNFTLADFRKAGFRDALIVSCIFDSAVLMDLKAERALFKDCSFRSLIADRSDFEETKLVGADWSNSEIYKGIWYRVQADGVCFINTNWFKTNWYEGHFSNCDFTDAKLWRTEGEKAVFENCNFQNVEFWEFEAKDAVFRNCDFRRSNLNLLRMENTILENCGFYECEDVPYCYFEGDSTSAVINPDFSPNFDGSSVVQTPSVKQFCDLLTQFQQQGWKNPSELVENPVDETVQLPEEKPTATLESDELANLKLQLADVEKKINKLNQRIKNLSGGKPTGELNRNNALITRIKELEKDLRKQRVLRQNLEREIAKLE